MRIGWPWLLALLPAVLGLAVTALVAGDRIENYRLFLRGGIGTVSALVGLLLSATAIAFLIYQRQQSEKHQRDIARLQSETAEERRRFLRRLDHELKNPLTAMRAGLANLAWLPSEEERKETLSSVETQALRLSRLAADLRKLADLETRSLERTPVDLGALLQEVMEVAQERPEAGERRLTLTVPRAPWPLPTIQGDPDLLFLAVHNLVDNALKFTQPADTVEIRAFEDGAATVVEVADTGPGIPQVDIDHIWDELYRGEGARGIPGSGLGLALVRAIVERHGGQVSLRSRAGQGTVFSLRLPLQ
jgi:two-component system OmpR family sensor kinase